MGDYTYPELADMHLMYGECRENVAAAEQLYKNNLLAYITSEDAIFLKGKVRVEEKVERIRRAHLNDLENIPIFLIISFIYVLTNPPVSSTTTLFRYYTIARFAHTLVYAIVVVPQPARGIIYTAGFGITGYMAVKNVLYFIQ